MPTVFAKLVKITAVKKLMIKINQDAFDKIDLATYSSTPGYKFPHFTLNNDDGEMNHFCIISLDRYDKQLLERKFEPLVKREVVIDYKLVPFDFVVDEERVVGMNLQLINIRKYNGKKPLFQQKEQEDDVDRAARAAVSPDTSLTPLEQHFDRELMAELTDRFDLPVVSDMPLAPPKLVRQ